MGLEAATFIHQLNPTNPVGAVDPKAQGDDHLRLIKSAIQATFPNITGAMTATQAQLNSTVTPTAPANKVKGSGAAAAGVAATVLHSDAQLLLDLADNYAWTGVHTIKKVGGGEQLRLIDDSAFFSFFNTLNSIRRGYIQAVTAGDMFVASEEAGRNLQLSTNGGRVVADSTTSVVSATLAKTALYIGSTERAFFQYDNGTVEARIDSDGALALAANNTVGLRLTAVAQPAAQFNDGTQALPSITFGSSPSSGWFCAAANDIRATTNGSQRLKIANTIVECINGVQLAPLLGTAGAPGLAFSTDLNTGLYGDNADGIFFAEGGVGFRVGFRIIPQNLQNANYTAVATDSGKHLLHGNGAGAGHTHTIPSNAAVPYDIGTAITFINRDSNVISIAITTDTLILAGGVLTGTRTLAQNGIATAIKVAATTWMISGTGLS